MQVTHRVVVLAAFLLAITACGYSGAKGPYPHVATLDPDNAKADGTRLIELPMGLHRLDRNPAPSRAVVMVHGWGSRGLEWVYPIVRLSDPDVATYFYRWDWNGCPAPAAETLAAGLVKVRVEHPGVEGVSVLGHSYGGLVVLEYLRDQADTVPQNLTTHVIASPLAGIEALTGVCGYAPLKAAKGLHEWRTLHELDGAFKDMAVDPQNVTIAGSKVTRLPDMYRGRRLGHNWAISWVADELADAD